MDTYEKLFKGPFRADLSNIPAPIRAEYHEKSLAAKKERQAEYERTQARLQELEENGLVNCLVESATKVDQSIAAAKDAVQNCIPGLKF